MPTPTVFPVSRRFIGVAKEAVAGTAVMPTITMPQTAFNPEDKPLWLKDEAWRNAMGATYGVIQGPMQSSLDMGGPFFGDSIGPCLLNMFGDYAVTGTAAGGGGSTTLTAPAVAGASTLAVTAITNFSPGDFIQIGTGTTAEVRKVLTAIATTITLDSTVAGGVLYYGHASAQTVVEVTGPYTHKFFQLNSGVGAGGSMSAQPPTNTFTDYTGMTPTVEARSYAGSVLSEIQITGAATDLLQWSGKGDGWVSAPTASKPVAAVSSTATQPSWRSKAGIAGPASGGTLVNNVQEWSYTISRTTSVEFTNQNSQNPFSIVRGGMAVTGGLKFMPAIDETPLSNMLTNAQPLMQIIADNGLAGLNQVTLTLDSQVNAYTASKLNSGGVPFGYDNEFECVQNTTNVGQSQGYGALTVTLLNNYPTY
jgi:hypothetical protein